MPFNPKFCLRETGGRGGRKEGSTVFFVCILLGSVLPQSMFDIGQEVPGQEEEQKVPETEFAA